MDGITTRGVLLDVAAGRAEGFVTVGRPVTPRELILVNDRNLLARFQVCDNLALYQLSALQPTKEIVSTELLSKFRGADDNNGGSRHGGT